MSAIRLCRLYRCLSYFDGRRTAFSTRNVRLYAFLPERISEPISVIAAVGQHPLRVWQIIEQSRYTGVIPDLTCSDEAAQRASIDIGNGMKFDVHATLRAADHERKILFFTRKLEAGRAP